MSDGLMREARPERASVVRYYDRTVRYYEVFWHGATGALHYGFHDENTRDPHSELLNTNRVLADIAGVRRGDRVFDAGCGIGGSATWLASERGARVLGVSLSGRQLREATARSAARGVSGRVAFQRADYAHAPFASGSFDVFWALESSCYTEDKREIADEARRLLRPGGRLVIGDGFRRRSPANARERDEYAAFLRGLVLPDLGTVEDLERALQAAGFAEVDSVDMTDAVQPSGRRMRRMCRLAHPLARSGRALGFTSQLLVDNVRAGIAQYRLIQAGVLRYAVVSATKPRQPSA